MKRLGKGDLYCSASDGKVASRLDEPRTPRIRCRGVSEAVELSTEEELPDSVEDEDAVVSNEQ